MGYNTSVSTEYQVEYLADIGTIPEGMKAVMYTDNRVEAGQILRAMGGGAVARILEWNGEFLQEA